MTDARSAKVGKGARVWVGVLTAAAVLGAQPADEVVGLAVTSNLLHSPAVSAHLIDVTVAEGVVTLDGSVSNLLSRDRARRIAAGIRGVKAVINELEIRPVARSDADILADIELALALDPATESYEVDVSIADGAVTLSGTVDSWAERRLAATVVKGVKGVRNLKNDIDVSAGEQRPDVEIRADVRRRLEADPFVNHATIDVVVDEGVVTLSGTVPTPAEKGRAALNARVAGSRDVRTQQLEVKLTDTGSMRRESEAVVLADSAVIGAIRQILRGAPRTAPFDLTVSMDSGIVVLQGVVDNLMAKKAALRYAGDIVGVSRIEEEIKVRPAGTHPVKEMEANANYVLAWDPVVERHELSVDVRNGKAYLYGGVDSHYERRRAEDIVARIPGVVDVDNRLVVSPVEWRWRSDSAITERVVDEFRWDWRVDHEDIDVRVEDGVVKLRGDVESRGELKAVVENAFDAGARFVTSRLDLIGMRYFRVHHSRGDITL
jgi:osmotically-inducible protein OsmY